MASSNIDQDFLPEKTVGFKVGEKKTIDEYRKLVMNFSSRALVAEIVLSYNPTMLTSNDECLPVFINCIQVFRIPLFKSRATVLDIPPT
ncbi:putative rho gdp-dissociation inhibitor [Golovinomyces cichoracearum]|uniref:Putative rho gdp-dissociation inhibitor n=1 Tax=Golovinomyces cichoracearum TaxID=62708 RepID=A0A420H965_9PEZI|nr:putative rho gdp-dissociation inhibitor [Golovinomyces cichoracearum]